MNEIKAVDECVGVHDEHNKYLFLSPFFSRDDGGLGLEFCILVDVYASSLKSIFVCTQNFPFYMRHFCSLFLWGLLYFYCVSLLW